MSLPKASCTPYARRPALVVAHPGHELRVFGWMQSARPMVFVLTDGSGSGGEARIESTTAILDRTSTRRGSIYGRLSDRDIYAAMLAHDHVCFTRLADELAEALVVARLLGLHELGIMVIALLALGVIEAVTSTGVDTALVSQPGDVERDLDSAFTLQAVRGVIVTVVLWTLAPLVASVFGNLAAVPVIRAAGIVALIRGFTNPAVALLIKRMDFRRLFWWSLPEVLTGVTLAVWFALLRRDVWALVLAILGAQVVATAASYLMAPRRPRLELRPETLRRLLHFGKWVSGSRTLTYLSSNADIAIVGTAYGTSALGLYQFASRISELPIATVTRAVGQVALPGFSELQDSPTRLHRTYWSALRLVLVVHCVFAGAILLFADVAVERLVGPGWLPAVPVLRILAIATIFRAVVVVASQLFFAVRQPRLTLEVNAARLAVLVASIGPLMLVYHMPGAALAVLLAGVAASALSSRLMRRARLVSRTRPASPFLPELR